MHFWSSSTQRVVLSDYQLNAIMTQSWKGLSEIQRNNLNVCQLLKSLKGAQAAWSTLYFGDEASLVWEKRLKPHQIAKISSLYLCSFDASLCKRSNLQDARTLFSFWAKKLVPRIFCTKLFVRARNQSCAQNIQNIPSSLFIHAMLSVKNCKDS